MLFDYYQQGQISKICKKKNLISFVTQTQDHITIMVTLAKGTVSASVCFQPLQEHPSMKIIHLAVILVLILGFKLGESENMW